MKNKKIVMCVALLLAFSLAASAETFKWKNVGVSTFVRNLGNIPTAEAMKKIVQLYAGDVKMGFEQAGMGELALPFLDQLDKGQFQEGVFPVGSKFEWMLFRVGGKVTVKKDVEWAGKKPLDVFIFSFVSNDCVYRFVMPKPCGNIAFLDKTCVSLPPPVCNLVVSPAKANINELITVDMIGTKGATSMEVDVLDPQGVKITSHTFTPESPKWQTKFDKAGDYTFKAKAVKPDAKPSENACTAKIVHVNYPPCCKLWTSCLPCKDYVGKPIVFDANSSTDSDGQVVKASFEILDEAGNVIDSAVKTQKPFTWEKIFNEPGKYVINVVVFDEMGAVSDKTSCDTCTVAFEVTQKKLFYLVEVGGMLARGTYTGYIFGRLGLLWNLVPNALDFILSAGGAWPPLGDPWKFIFMGNALLNIHLGESMYLGAGLGYSTKEQDNRLSGIDLVGNFGINIFNNYSSAGSIFAEVRVPVLTPNRDVDRHYKLLLGFRYIF
jgi:hypothetical protein